MIGNNTLILAPVKKRHIFTTMMKTKVCSGGWQREKKELRRLSDQSHKKLVTTSRGNFQVQQKDAFQETIFNKN